MPTELTNEQKPDAPLLSSPENPLVRHPRIFGQNARETTTDYANPREIRVRIVPGEDLQDAINRVEESAGGVIFLREGTYLINKQINLKSSVYLFGETRDGTILDFNNTAGFLNGDGTNVYTTGTITSISSDGATVTGLATNWLTSGIVPLRDHLFINQRWHFIAAITGNTTMILAENYSGPTVSAGSSYRVSTLLRDIRVENITLKNSTGTALDVDDARGFLMENLLFQDNNIGFRFEHSTEIATDKVIAVSQTSDGVQLDNVGFADFESIATEANGGNGVTLTTCRTVPFTTSGSNRNTGDGYNLTGCNDVLLEVQSNRNGGQGIECVSGNDNILIRQALIEGNTSDGIKLTATSDNAKILSARITNNGGWGINIAASTNDNAIIVANSFSGNTSGAINNAGTSTVATGNRGASSIGAFLSAGARGYRATTAQAITTGTATKVQFNAESFDPDGNFDSTTNHRFTAPVAGYYSVVAKVYLEGLAADRLFSINLRKNGADYSQIHMNSSISSDLSQTNADILQLAVNDFLEVFVTHNHGSDRNVALGDGATFLSVQLLSEL